MTRCSRLLTPGLLALLAGLVTPGALAREGADLDECAIEPAMVPAFSLVDLNPNSATYGLSRTRDEFLGQVVVIYWAVST